MAAPAPARPVRPVWGTTWSLSRALIIVSVVCFVVAALVAGSVFTGQSWIAWALGGVAAWLLAWAV